MKQEFYLIDARLKRTKPRPDSSASGVSVWCGSGQGAVSRYHLRWRSTEAVQGQNEFNMESCDSNHCPLEIDSSGLRRWRRRRRRRWVSIKSCDRYPRGDNRYVKGMSEITESHGRHLRSQECGGYLSPEHIITVVMTDRVYRVEPHQSSPTHACTHVHTRAHARGGRCQTQLEHNNTILLVMFTISWNCII